MKRKIQTLIALLFVACSSAFAQTQMVTFQVENPASTPVYVFGSWSGWGNYPGNSMTMIAPGKYSVTLPIASNTTHEYLFVSGATPANEVLTSTWPCTNGNTQYTNRVLPVGSTDTAVCYTWATCNTCTVTPPPPPPMPINVTFQVESPDSLPVSLIGSWNWAAFPGAPMTLIAPNKYSVTIQLMPNAPYEYLFVNGGTPIKEALDPAWPCTNANAQYTNRVLGLGANDTSLCYTWATCNSCTVTPPPSNVNITLQVETPDSTPVYVIGSWNWANYPGILMTSIGGNKYEAVVSLPSNSTAEYLYVNGGTPIKEVLDPAWACTNGNAQYTNRTLAIGSSAFTKCNKWALCDSCGSVAPSNINVKFSVQSTDSTPVYVFGSWSNWGNFPGNPMTFNAATGNYEATIPMASSATIEYLYVNGIQTKEVLDSSWTCTNGNPQYTNRKATLGTVDTSFCNIWETCTACVPLTLNNVKNENVSIYLNSQFIRINATNISQFDQLEIFDLVGRKVFASNGNFKTNENISVNLKSNTFYIVRLKNGNDIYKVKSFINN